jgi:hypothetical protein
VFVVVLVPPPHDARTSETATTAVMCHDFIFILGQISMSKFENGTIIDSARLPFCATTARVHFGTQKTSDLRLPNRYCSAVQIISMILPIFGKRLHGTITRLLLVKFV